MTASVNGHAPASAADEALLTKRYGAGAPELVAQLRALSDVGGHAGVTKFLYDVYLRRPDLQRAYPDLDGEGGHRLVDWAYRSGSRQEPWLSMFLPTAWLQAPAAVGGKAGVSRYLAMLRERTPDLQEEFPDLAGRDAARYVAWAHTYGALENPVIAALIANGHRPDGEPPASRRPPPIARGVNLIGCLRGALGLGEAARLTVAALDAVEVPVMPVHYDVAPSADEHPYAAVDIDLGSFDTDVVCLNADHHWGLVRDAPGCHSGRYTIGFWWWEVGSGLPHAWRATFPFVDEIWAGSEFVAETIRAISPVPVCKLRIPVQARPIAPASRAELGLPQAFVFLCLFDYSSTLERKNPLAAIRAFRRAFPPGSGAALVLKSVNGALVPADQAHLESVAAGHPDIHTIDRYASPAEKNAMLASCDCLVSLHRAEGFGLPLAEAMYLGKPVVATGC